MISQKSQNLPPAWEEDEGGRVALSVMCTPSIGNQFMDAAFTYAQEALRAGEVPIGCVFVLDSQVIGGGRNIVNERKNATRHAELVAVDQVLEWSLANNGEGGGGSVQEIFSKCHLYVTVEPCIMCEKINNRILLVKV